MTTVTIEIGPNLRAVLVDVVPIALSCIAAIMALLTVIVALSRSRRG